PYSRAHALAALTRSLYITRSPTHAQSPPHTRLASLLSSGRWIILRARAGLQSWTCTPSSQTIRHACGPRSAHEAQRRRKRSDSRARAVHSAPASTWANAVVERSAPNLQRPLSVARHVALDRQFERKRIGCTRHVTRLARRANRRERRARHLLARHARARLCARLRRARASHTRRRAHPVRHACRQPRRTTRATRA